MASSMARRFSSSLGGSAAWARTREPCHRRQCRVTACVHTAHRLLTGLPTLCMHGAQAAAGCMVLCIVVISAELCMNWPAAAGALDHDRVFCTESHKRRRHWQRIAEPHSNSDIARRRGAPLMIVWPVTTVFGLTLR